MRHLIIIPLATRPRRRSASSGLSVPCAPWCSRARGRQRHRTRPRSCPHSMEFLCGFESEFEIFIGIPSELRLPRFSPRSELSTTNWYSGSRKRYISKLVVLLQRPTGLQRTVGHKVNWRPPIEAERRQPRCPHTRITFGRHAWQSPPWVPS